MAEEGSGGSSWTWNEDKAFEDAVGSQYLRGRDVGSDGFWTEIAEAVPGKSTGEVKEHYEALVEDLRNIVAGLFPLPDYVHPSTESFAIDGDSSTSKVCRASDGDDGVKESRSTSEDGHGGSSKRCRGNSDAGVKGLRSSQDREPRQKGVPWSEDEHARFVAGLERYGKGEWRRISMHYVRSRTATQVASHAQKYFLRMSSTDKGRRRSSIHDKTTVSDEDRLAMEGMITVEANGPTITCDKLVRYSPQPQPDPSGFYAYGTMKEHTFDALVSAVPINCSTPVEPHLADRMQTPPFFWTAAPAALPGYFDGPMNYASPPPLS